MQLRFLLLSAAAAMLAACLVPVPVQAHAVLLAAEPQDGARLDTAPPDVRLEFNEPVTPARVRILDGDGVEVAGPDAVMAHGSMVHVALPADLRDGGYVVSYRVVSLDGHPVVGSTVFLVGAAGNVAAGDVAAGNVAAGPADRSASLAVAGVAVRAAFYLSLFVAAGGALFILLVTGPGHPCAGRFAPVMVFAALAAVASAGGRVGLTGAELVDGTLDGVWQAAAWVAGCRASVAQSGIAAAAGMAAIVLGLRTLRRPAAPVLLVAGALAAFLSLAASGHAATAPPRWLSAPLVVLHGAAAAYWIGAFWPLAVVLRVESPDAALAIVRRFARIAAAVVVLLALAGSALTLLQVGSPAALLGTWYGRVWLIKLALVLALLALAAVNRQILTPALMRAARGAANRLRRSVAMEAGLAVAIAVATASFALEPPPRALSQARQAGVDNGTDPHAGHHAAAGAAAVIEVLGRVATVSIVPGRRGANAVSVRLTSGDGGALATQAARIEMALPALGIEPITRELKPGGDGTYVLEAADLPIAGNWSLRVDVLVNDFEKTIFRADIPVGE